MAGVPSGDPLAKLRRVIAAENWVAFDTEATDLGPRAEVIEIAIVYPDGTAFEALVRPNTPSSTEAASIHRIDAAELERAIPFRTIAANVRRRLSGRVVLAFNADFDRRLLWSEFARAGQPAPRSRWLCLCDLVTKWSGRRHSLAGALREVGLECGPMPHRAVSDARAVVSLARALIQRPARS
jgi:DNA polymerase-3 subunit epsilon